MDFSLRKITLKIRITQSKKTQRPRFFIHTSTHQVRAEAKLSLFSEVMLILYHDSQSLVISNDYNVRNDVEPEIHYFVINFQKNSRRFYLGNCVVDSYCWISGVLQTKAF